MSLFTEIFSWWGSSTWGTRLYTWRFGTPVGEDGFGNVYFEGDGGRRWVRYAGDADASAIPPGWHGWMHYRTDTPPAREDYAPREWEKPHRPNLTGTAEAYLPRGSIANPADRPRVTGDYEAWRP